MRVVQSLGTFAGRYRLDDMLHKSATSVVIAADDVTAAEGQSAVVVKLMKNEDQCEREVHTRKGMDGAFVVGVATYCCGGVMRDWGAEAAAGGDAVTDGGDDAAAAVALAARWGATRRPVFFSCFCPAAVPDFSTHRRVLSHTYMPLLSFRHTCDSHASIAHRSWPHCR